MVYKVIFSPEAIKEIDLSICYFKVNRIEAAFLKDLNEQFIYLENYPLSRQIRYKNIRIHLLKKFNYSLHYTVEDSKVYILRFLNQNQDF